MSFPDHSVTIVIGYDDAGRAIEAPVPCPFHYHNTPAPWRGFCRHVKGAA